MRGQFFIISAVIIISALVLITQYLYDFGRTNLAAVAELRETDYVRYVKASLNNTALSPCAVAGAELTAAENFLATELAGRGMQLVTVHNVNVAGKLVDIRFNITSPGFSSQTAFTAACM